MVLVCFKKLNPCDFAIVDPITVEFRVGASNEESSLTFVKNELSLFRWLSVPPASCVDPLGW